MARTTREFGSKTPSVPLDQRRWQNSRCGSWGAPTRHTTDSRASKSSRRCGLLALRARMQPPARPGPIVASGWPTRPCPALCQQARFRHVQRYLLADRLSSQGVSAPWVALRLGLRRILGTHCPEAGVVTKVEVDVSTQRPILLQRRLGVAGHALVLGAQQLWRRCHHYGLGSLVDPHSLGRQGIDPQPRHHDGAARVAGWGAHWVSSRHRRRRAPSPCASRSKGREEQQ